MILRSSGGLSSQFSIEKENLEIVLTKIIQEKEELAETFNDFFCQYCKKSWN